MNQVRIWDLPVRLFHWVFVLGFAAAFSIAQLVDDESPTYTIHMILGLMVAFSVILRVIWGLLGSRTARFLSFVLSPKLLMAYFLGIFRKEGARYPVRNPAASYAALAMGLLALGMATTGILIPKFGHDVKEVHEVFAYSLLAVGILHVLGVAFHVFRHRDRLALSMIDGKNKVGANVEGVSRYVPAAVIFLAFLGVWTALLVKNFDSATGVLRVPGFGVVIEPERKEDEAIDRASTSFLELVFGAVSREALAGSPAKSGLLFQPPPRFKEANKAQTQDGGSILEFVREGDRLSNNREIVSVSTIAKPARGMPLDPILEAQEKGLKDDGCKIEVIEPLKKTGLSTLFTYRCESKPGSGKRTGNMRLIDGDAATIYMLLWEFDSNLESKQKVQEALNWLRAQKSCSIEKPTDCI